MKTLLSLLLVATIAVAREIPLVWDASTTPGVTNYVLYASPSAFSATNFMQADCRFHLGTNLTATLDGFTPGRWYFAVTAMKDGLMSDPSNILSVDVSSPPSNLRTDFPPQTNATNVGFLQLKNQ